MIAATLLNEGGQLFSKRGAMLHLWQEIAEQFYPERADFTSARTPGISGTSSLATGYPVLARRDLGNAIGAMLRPTNKAWNHPRVDKWDEAGTEARAFLERAETRQRQAMYYQAAQFVRATKEADHDFAAFGQACIQVTKNHRGDQLLYRCWHLRDVAWMEGADGTIDCVYRKWKPTLNVLITLFGKNVHPKVKASCEKDPYAETEVWHVVKPSTNCYDKKGKEYDTPFVSVYLDVANQHVMEEVGLGTLPYVIPRWQTVSGSQYAYSPAVTVALSDALTLQTMTLTLLEAGEKHVSPPMLAVQEALRGDINIMASGVTWVDREYDERLGEVLRPLTMDKSGMPIGFEMAADLREQLASAFYLNKLALPPPDREMTAYETGQRVQEYIRQSLPLFEPMEAEYNAPVCRMTFEILMGAGVFGSHFEIPEELLGKEVIFTFESPLHDAIEKEKGQRFLEATSLIANAAAADPGVIHLLDVKKAARDVLHSTGVPAAWLRTESEVDALTDADREAQQAQQLLQQMQQGANVAKTIGDTAAPAGTLNTGAVL